MATEVTVDSSTYASVVEGPKDVYLQNHGVFEVAYRVDTTGAQSLDADHMVLKSKALHPVRVPTGSSLYARVREKSLSRSVKVSFTETYLGPE